jgi:hypothetical protein
VGLLEKDAAYTALKASSQGLLEEDALRRLTVSGPNPKAAGKCLRRLSRFLPQSVGDRGGRSWGV